MEEEITGREKGRSWGNERKKREKKSERMRGRKVRE